MDITINLDNGDAIIITDKQKVYCERQGVRYRLVIGQSVPRPKKEEKVAPQRIECPRCKEAGLERTMVGEFAWQCVFCGYAAEQ